MTSCIILDASYYCFYRYYAILQWWKFSRPDKEIDENMDEFMLHFHNQFVSTLQKLSKTLKLSNPTLIIGKDCPRKDIWRTSLYPNYKATRDYGEQPLLRHAFSCIYSEKWFEEGGFTQILYHPHLEADDVIALYSKQLPSDTDIHIITSDTDYLQLLVNNNITIHTLKGKLLSDTKTYDGNPEKYLFCKCLTGDKSDNIPPAFPKCGIKTAEKCWNEPDFLEKKLKDPKHKAQYTLNKTLISFDCIPNEHSVQFLTN